MPVRVVVTLVTAALLLPAAAGAAPQKRIVGGTTATTTELPFMAGLEIALQGQGNSGPDALCGGSLIAARWVLTAAHCLAEDPVDVANSYAIIGATNLNAETEDQRYQWAEVFFPPEYATSGGGSDVGLVRLARPATAQQLRLLRPADTALYAPGTTALTAGWGFTEDSADGGSISTTQLRKVDLQITSDQACHASFAEAGQASLLDFATMICAIAPNKDSCNGDSGGPLIVTDAGGLPALVGDVSFGIGSGDILRGNRSCNEGPPGVYGRLGVDPLNAFVRARVPQVEIDADGTPVPGGTLRLTAVPSNPTGDGPFNGYDALAWDVDGDGPDDGTGREATVTLGDGPQTVSVLATSDAGDAEVRSIRLVPVAKSAVAFAKARVTTRVGRTVRLRVNRVGTGGGSVSVTGHRVRPGRRTLTFSGSEASRTVRFKARRKGTVTLRLGSYAGDVVAGARTTMKLKIRKR